MTVDSDRLRGSSRAGVRRRSLRASEEPLGQTLQILKTVHDAFRSQGPRQGKFAPTTPTAVKLQVDAPGVPCVLYLRKASQFQAWPSVQTEEKKTAGKARSTDRAARNVRENPHTGPAMPERR